MEIWLVLGPSGTQQLQLEMNHLLGCGTVLSRYRKASSSTCALV